MKLAYTMSAQRGQTDLLLADVAQILMQRGFRVCGTVQVNTERPKEGPCDMDVRVLPDGPLLRISQSLGVAARGCRLDPAALETAVAEVATRLDARTDLLIVNKFGKHEADGRGFRETIAEAIGLGIPVLVGLNALNQAAFEDFAGPQTAALDPKVDSVLHWVEAALAPQVPDLACA